MGDHSMKRTIQSSRRRRQIFTIEQLEARWTPSVDVLTYHYDMARTGANTAETVLTPSNVNAAAFGKQFTLPTDGYVYAQPLLKTGVTVPGQGVHDVLYVATEHDSLYAFDAHGSNPVQGYLWKDSFINPSAGITTIPSNDIEPGYSDIVPEIGITSTPIIDQNTNTLYLDTALKVVSGGTTTYQHTIHAIDLATGAEKFGGPIVVHGSVPGAGDGGSTVTFNALIQNQRTGLALANVNGTEVLDVAFGSRGDVGTFHGWVMSYNATTLQPISVFCSTPNGQQSTIYFGGGGIWLGGGAIPVDQNGNIYINTGNGTFDANAGGSDYGDTMLKLSANNLAINSTFTPINQDTLNQQDLDFGTGGIVLLPTQSSAHPNELITADKTGKIYLLNRDSLGGYGTGPGGTDSVLGTINLSAGLKDPMAYFNGNLYVGENGSPIQSYSIFNGILGTSPTSQSGNTFGPGGSAADGSGTNPTISANGTSNGIVWALDISTFDSGGSAILYAYNASNLAQMLYNSNQAGSRDQAGAAVKFTAPLVSGGLVYVPGQSSVTVYGLFNSSSGLVTAINAGGGSAGSYLADAGFTGGTTATSADPINTSSVTNPAPQTVYDTERYGNFTYTVPGLTAGANYTVRLHFAEFYWNAVGQRVFNVLINGVQVLTNFDILATAGGKDIAIIRQFTATANSSGRIIIQFTTVVDNAKLSGLEILGTPNQVHLVTAIDAGGGAAGTYLADANFTGGRAYSNADPINTSGVTNPAPQAVYDSERVGNFTYTIPGLTAGVSYTVRLHFAEIYWNAAGLRSFNVLINGAQVLTNFDIFAAAGGKDIALVRQFTAVANSSGRLVIQFTTVVDNAKLSGLEILSV